MSCIYEVTSDGNLNIQPSNNKIAFGKGNSSTTISSGEISFGVGDEVTKISKSGVQKKKVEMVVSSTTKIMEIDVKGTDYNITVTSDNQQVETIKFTNVEEGESGKIVIFYFTAFTKDVIFSVDGGLVKSKNGNMNLTNIEGVYDIVNYYCFDDQTVLIELDSYATIDGFEITTKDVAEIQNILDANIASTDALLGVVDPPLTVEFGTFENGIIDVHVNFNSIMFDLNANKRDALALAFDYSGITLSSISFNPMTELTFIEVNQNRVALMSLNTDAVIFSDISNTITMKMAYTELYGPEPFTIDGYYPLYYDSQAVSGVFLSETTITWSNDDNNSYYINTNSPFYRHGDYLRSIPHNIKSVELLDSSNVSYSTTDTFRLYVEVVNSILYINGSANPQLNFMQNGIYTFIIENFDVVPFIITDNSVIGNDYLRGITKKYEKLNTHPGTITFTHLTHPQFYYQKIMFKPSNDDPKTLFYRCSTQPSAGSTINIIKQNVIPDSSGYDTYFLNASISNEWTESQSNGTYMKLDFEVIDDPYDTFIDSCYTAKVTGVYSFTLNIHGNVSHVKIVKVGSTLPHDPPVIINTQDASASKTYIMTLTASEQVCIEFKGTILNDSSFTAYLLSSKRP